MQMYPRASGGAYFQDLLIPTVFIVMFAMTAVLARLQIPALCE